MTPSNVDMAYLETMQSVIYALLTKCSALQQRTAGLILVAVLG